MKPFKTIAEMLRYTEQNYSNPQAMGYQPDGNRWEYLSTREFLDEVKHLSLGLRNLGVKKGDMIGILANSSPRWSIADLAIMIAGGVSVPLFANISDENFDFEVSQTNLKRIFVSGEEQWEKYELHESFFDTAISLYPNGHSHKAFRYEELIEQGRTLAEREPRLYDELLDAIKFDDLATIVYTSGSTGFPKGAMLTQENIIGLVHTDPFHWNRDSDLYLSILPLAHIFARALNFIMISWGIRIAYLKDIKMVGDACRELHPTIVVLVPRLLEKIYAKMLAGVSHAGFLKRTIGHWAFSLANDEHDSLYKQLLHPVADKIVYSALRNALGGSLRVVISGGAALDPHLCHFFRDIGVPLIEGWGLTEASTVTCNRLEKTKIGSVGKPFDGMIIKTGVDGEVLVRGPIVLQGYYKNIEATAKTFTEDGWLRTGDKGSIDDDGYLTLQGRIKELYKTSTGEYIAPVPIEQELCRVPFIDMAVVVADGRKYASCLLFPNFDVVHSLKVSHRMETMSDEEFLHSEFVKSEMAHLLKDINAHLNHWEEVHAYRFVMNTPSIEGGELTPTMKIRRGAVEKKYKDLIDSIYLVKELV